MIEQLPGYNGAIEMGYTLSAYSGDMGSATYRKCGVDLTVYENGTCTLSAVIGMLMLSTGKISFPNKNLKIFEKQVSDVVEVCERELGL